MSDLKMLELSKQRVSCRNYLDKPVPDEILKNCLEAAHWAPSACNKQPWRFVIVKDDLLRQKICTEGFLPGIPMPWAVKAPVIVVLCAKINPVTHWLAPMVSGINYHYLDLGIAGEHFVLAAEEQGIGSCWIGWFKAKYIKKILKLPSNLKPVSLITLGYSADLPLPSRRLPLDELFRENIWKK
ncbi:nitroreductase family protein [Lentisphaerota bacterium ZTH]|nr:nitroreductase family protein [Lentisphaerota bacterium]WET05255.1 nitroreductase family protein [Lentisphaerota bacterium ZTH]